MSHTRRWNERCKVCQKRKPPSKPIREAMAQYNVGAPLERIALDIMGPLLHCLKLRKDTNIFWPLLTILEMGRSLAHGRSKG